MYERYQVHDELWRAQAFPLPPPKKNKDTPGRPTTDDRKSTNAIFYVLRTGCQWKALPRSLGAPSTVHDGFEEWKKAELSRRQGRRVCSSTTRIKGIEWEWQSMATVTTKAPLGGKAPAPTPRKGRTGPTLKSIVIERAKPTRGARRTCAWTRDTTSLRWTGSWQITNCLSFPKDYGETGRSRLRRRFLTI